MSPRMLVGLSVVALLTAACGSDDAGSTDVPGGDPPAADEQVEAPADSDAAVEPEASAETEPDVPAEPESDVPAETEPDVPPETDEPSDSEVADARRESLDRFLAEDIAASLRSGNEPFDAISLEEAQCAGTGLVDAIGADRLQEVDFAAAFGPFETPPIDLTIDEARLAAAVILDCIPSTLDQMAGESDLSPTVYQCAVDRMLADGLFHEGLAWTLVMGAEVDLESVMPGAAQASQQIIAECSAA